MARTALSPVAVYEIRTTFRAPLPFAYRWCTDYTAEDRKLEGNPGRRQILSRGRRTVVYEDLNDTPHGWMWSRQTVTLRPPDRWDATAVGNYRTWDLQYSLRRLDERRTEFRMRGERRATPLGGRNPSKSALEHELRVMWRNLGRNLEKDYRRSLRGHRRRGARTRGPEREQGTKS
jgi:hypothetical protein